MGDSGKLQPIRDSQLLMLCVQKGSEVATPNYRQSLYNIPPDPQKARPGLHPHH